MVQVDQGAKYIVADPGDRDVARVRCREELLHGDTGDNYDNDKVIIVVSIHVK